MRVSLSREKVDIAVIKTHTLASRSPVFFEAVSPSSGSGVLIFVPPSARRPDRRCCRSPGGAVGSGTCRGGAQSRAPASRA